MRSIIASVALAVLLLPRLPTGSGRTGNSIADGRWHLDGQITYSGTPAEGLFMNVRMANAVFDDTRQPEFDAEANTNEFTAGISEYVEYGIHD